MEMRRRHRGYEYENDEDSLRPLLANTDKYVDHDDKKKKLVTNKLLSHKEDFMSQCGNMSLIFGSQYMNHFGLLQYSSMNQQGYQ